MAENYLRPNSEVEITIADNKVEQGGEITIPTHTESGYPITTTITITDASGATTTEDVTGQSSYTPKARGIYVMTSMVEGLDPVVTRFRVIDPDNVLDNNFDGLGTEKYPYLINGTDDFLLLGKDDIQEYILADKVSADTVFELQDDIDLSNIKKTYAVRVFAGTLDGNEKTITAGNIVSFIFKNIYEDVTFKDFTIQFADNNVTRLFYECLLSVSETFKSSEYTAAGDDLGGPSDCYIYDKYAGDGKDSINLLIDNVDYKGVDGVWYNIGDQNSALYATDNVSAMTVYDKHNNKYIETYFTCIRKSQDDIKTIKYNIEIKNCNVSGNFLGGFGASGAAIFLGGQMYGADASISNSSFSGNFLGQNISLLVANSSGMGYSKINITNVANNGEIISLGDNSTLYFSNSSSNIINGNDVFNGGRIDGKEMTKDKGNLSFSSPTRNGVFENNNETGRYQLKIFAPSFYWYEKGSSTYAHQTNSNTITFNLASGKDIYHSRVISATEAAAIASEALEFDINWVNVADKTNEGDKYTFIDYNGDKFLVIQYIDSIYEFKYTNKNDLSVDGISKREYMKNALLISYDSDGSIKDSSSLITLN